MCIFQSFQKFTKLYRWSYFSKGHLGAPGDDKWGTPGLHPTSRRGQGGGRATMWCGPLLAPLTHLFLPSHSLSRKTRTSFLSLAFLLKSSRFFDLFAQPRFLSEFGTFALRYVTPLIIQVEFCLVEYILNILLL